MSITQNINVLKEYDYVIVGAGIVGLTISYELLKNNPNKTVLVIENPSIEKGFYGVRAQCVSLNGDLVDDFVIEENDNLIILRNVPSPAATSSFAIAKYVLQNFNL